MDVTKNIGQQQHGKQHAMGQRAPWDFMQPRCTYHHGKEYAEMQLPGEFTTV